MSFSIYNLPLVTKSIRAPLNLGQLPTPIHFSTVDFRRVGQKANVTSQMIKGKWHYITSYIHCDVYRVILVTCDTQDDHNRPHTMKLCHLPFTIYHWPFGQPFRNWLYTPEHISSPSLLHNMVCTSCIPRLSVG